MGLAMAAVVFFHCSMDESGFPIISFLQKSGDIGVDIFFLISGMGIYFSVRKHRDLRTYVRSRLLRILPAYFLVNGMWFLVQDFILNRYGLGVFLLDITSLNFWINGRLTTWYLSSLILLQMLTPCYLRLRERYPCFQICCIAAFYFAATAICLVPGFGRAAGHLLVFIFRIPAYLIGLAIGKQIEDAVIIPVKKHLVWAAGLVCTAVIILAYGYFPIDIPWSLKYAAYMPLAIILSFLAARIPEKSLASYLGTRSLEVYLLHEKILWLLSACIRKLYPTAADNSWAVNLIAIVSAFLGAEVLRRLIAVLTGYLAERILKKNE